MCVCVCVCVCIHKHIFIYFNWRLITLKYSVWFLPCIDMNQPQGTQDVSPHPEPSSQLPPHPIPLSCPRPQALSALLHSSNLHW